MSIDSVMAKLQQDEVGCQIYLRQQYYDKGQWEVNLHKNAHGINVAIECKGENFIEVLYDAWGKYQSVIDKGAPELKPKQIDYFKSEYERDKGVDV